MRGAYLCGLAMGMRSALRCPWAGSQGQAVMKFGENGLGQFRLIARVSLWFAGVGLVVLAALFAVGASASSDYLNALISLSATRRNLPVLFAIGCVVVMTGTALIAGLIALYGSFRIAGPVHRFCIDLETGIRSGVVPAIRVRSSDLAQSEACKFDDGVRELYRHYDRILGVVGELSVGLRTSERVEPEHVERLQEVSRLTSRVRT